MLDAQLEEHLRLSISNEGHAPELTLDPSAGAALAQFLASCHARHPGCVLLVPVDIRRHLRKLVEPHCFDLRALSFHEVVPSLKVDVVERVGLDSLRQLES